MRTAIVGAHGQLGRALQKTMTGEVVPLGHEQLDVTDPSSVDNALNAARAKLVINCAAYNLVDRAEDEPQQAYEVNALGPRNLAAWCQSHDATLLHVSSDYVFGLDAGRNVPYRESDAPGPTGAYAVSKLSGENFVRSTCPRHFVVRTCGLYGDKGTRGKGNFVETMLRLGAEKGRVSVVDDQECTPTSAADLAVAIAALVRTDAYGLYHATNTGSMTWFTFACEIFKQAEMPVDVRPTTTAEFGAKAARPRYSVLDTSLLTSVIGTSLPPWQDALARYLAERSTT